MNKPLREQFCAANKEHLEVKLKNYIEIWKFHGYNSVLFKLNSFKVKKVYSLQIYN